MRQKLGTMGQGKLGKICSESHRTPRVGDDGACVRESYEGISRILLFIFQVMRLRFLC
jgi:hypothetical protein